MKLPRPRPALALVAGGAFVIALAMVGAVTMLWRSDLGAPWPRPA